MDSLQMCVLVFQSVFCYLDMGEMTGSFYLKYARTDGTFLSIIKTGAKCGPVNSASYVSRWMSTAVNRQGGKKVELSTFSLRVADSSRVLYGALLHSLTGTLVLIKKPSVVGVANGEP